MRSTYVLAMIISSLLAQQALAAEKWGGFYAGVELGYIKGDDDGKEYDNPPGDFFNGWMQNPQPDGFGLGLRAGYNWTLGDNFLLGIEGAFNNSSAKDRVYQYNAAGDDCDPASDCQFTTRIGNSYSILGRAGYRVSDNVLIYALGGYTNAKIKRTIYDGWFLVGSDTHTDRQDGWTLGIGGEYLFSDAVSVRLEYRHTDLGKESLISPAYEGVIERFDYKQDELSIGAYYHF